MATLSRDPQAQGNVPVEEENVSTIHDLLIARAADRVQNPLLCFPRSERGTIDYDEFTGEDIDRMVDHAAKYYLSSGLGPVGLASYRAFLCRYAKYTIAASKQP